MPVRCEGQRQRPAQVSVVLINNGAFTHRHVSRSGMQDLENLVVACRRDVKNVPHRIVSQPRRTHDERGGIRPKRVPEGDRKLVRHAEGATSYGKVEAGHSAIEHIRDEYLRRITLVKNGQIPGPVEQVRIA